MAFSEDSTERQKAEPALWDAAEFQRRLIALQPGLHQSP
jgi:hypothetical protein